MNLNVGNMKTNNIQRIEFFNREMEKEEILNILKTEPQLINFIYGPINSGKTTLITNLVDDLSKDNFVFYINLRGKLINKYEEFIRVLFAVKKEGPLAILKNFIKRIFGIGTLPIRYFTGVPAEKWMIDDFFKSKNPEDVFEFLENYFKEISKKGKIILIVDELQVIGDLEIDGKLIYKLFNFFIRLTKELHICHVFALSSDSLFIEKVYNEAMLEGRANYILVDDFDEETAGKFLETYKFTDVEIRKTLQYLGGKPGRLIEVIRKKQNKKDVSESVKDILETRGGKIEEILYSMKNRNRELFDKVKDILENFRMNEDVRYTYISDEIRFLSKQNILFVNPIKKIIKPQSKVDLIAIRSFCSRISGTVPEIRKVLNT